MLSVTMQSLSQSMAELKIVSSRGSGVLPSPIYINLSNGLNSNPSPAVTAVPITTDYQLPSTFYSSSIIYGGGPHYLLNVSLSGVVLPLIGTSTMT